MLGLLLGAWVGRWAVLEVASYLVRKYPPPVPAPDPERPPGWMPGPFDA